MPSVIAKRMCPGLIFVKHRFERYHELSSQVFSILERYSGLVEPLSIDEAFLDVTSDLRGIGSATILARQIKHQVREETGLTASAGISVNKFLAKIASDINKPDGLFVIPPEKAEEFIEKLPVEKFYGIGRVTAEKMHRLGIHFGSDLKKWDMVSLVRNFGKAGVFYHEIARGIDNRPVETTSERKSVGTELTFEKDLTTMFAIIAELYRIEKELMKRLDEAGTTGKTVTVKVKFADFRQITRSRTLKSYVSDFATLHAAVTEIRKSMDLEGTMIRLLGVSISNLDTEEEQEKQLHLFED
jgi:DNA polymerase-4